MGTGNTSWLSGIATWLVPIHLPDPMRLILQALVNPHVSSWGYRHRLFYRGFEFFYGPDLPLSGCAENFVQVILRPPMQA